MKIYPFAFTEKEGGEYIPWDGSSIDTKQLNQIRDINFSIINGFRVHSLCFENPAAGLGNFPRWDCVNGWTTTIKKAKENFPKGLHGIKRVA